MSQPKDQGRHWGRHAAGYDSVFLDPFRDGVVNPWLDVLAAVPDAGSKTAIDLGCGTGPLLPWLVERFGSVIALDFAPAMLDHAKQRLGQAAERVTFEARSMDDLADFAEKIDVAVAINSLVMPDVRAIDRTLRSIRAALKPDGLFIGVVPSIDAIHYHTMLLLDRALDRGLSLEEAERHAAYHGEHVFYDFAFGRFRYRGLRMTFWHPADVEYRLRKAGFASVELDRVLYPWDESVPGGDQFADQPRSWDWSFVART